MKKTPLLALGTLLLVLLLAAWTTPRPAAPDQPLTLDELVDLAGCDKFSCFERKAEALGFRYEKSREGEAKTTYMFFRPGPDDERQILSLYLAKKVDATNGVSFAVEADKHRSYAGDLAKQAAAKDFTEDSANPHVEDADRYELFSTATHVLEIHRNKTGKGTALYIVALFHR